MIISINKVILCGTVSNIAVGSNGNILSLSFWITMIKRWEKDGQNKEKQTRVKCSVWGKHAAWLEPVLEEGQTVLVDGEIQFYEKNGVDNFEVGASHVKILA